jgi:hypothetical protein
MLGRLAGVDGAARELADGSVHGRRCGAVRHDTHARLRAGTGAAPLRGAAGLVSSAMLRRSASMRFTTRWGTANADKLYVRQTGHSFGLPAVAPNMRAQ